MRTVLLFVVALLCLPGVFAASIFVPTELEGGQYNFDVNSAETIRFTIRGDEVEQRIEFFVRVISHRNNDFIEFNGDSEFRVADVLDPFQTKQYTVEFNALREQRDVQIEYGYTYRPIGEDGIGMVQVVSGTFNSDLIGRSRPVVDEREEEFFEATSTASSAERPLEELLDEAQARESQDAQVQDVSSSGSATNNIPTPQFTAQNPLERQRQEASPEGMIVLGIFIGFLIAFALVNLVSINTLKREIKQAGPEVKK